MNSIQYDNNRVENSKENEKVGRVRRRRGSSYPINRSINRGLHERNKEGGEKERAKNIFATRSNGGGISTNLSHLTSCARWPGHNHSSHYHHLHALEIVPNIRTSRHSTHYEFIGERRKGGEFIIFAWTRA